MTVFESCFHNRNVSEGNSIWLSERQTTWCQNLNIKASKSLSKFKRIPNRKIVKYERRLEGGTKKPFVNGSQHKEYTHQRNLTPEDISECSEWRAGWNENWNMKLQNSSFQHLIGAVCNCLVKGFHRDGRERHGWWSTPLCTDIHWSLFSFTGGQTIFIWCPLKYTYSVFINLTLQHSAVRHYATAALSPQPGPKEERYPSHSPWLCSWLIVCHFLDSQYSAEREGRACFSQHPQHNPHPCGCSPLTTKVP